MAGCTGAQGALPPPRLEPLSGSRLGAFSVVDPPSEVPASAAIGDSQARVQSLAPPLPQRAELTLLHAFFRAITDENLEELATLLSANATVPGKTRGVSSTMLDHWRGRMNHLRYQPLAGETLFDEAQVESYRFEDWDGDALLGRPERPLDMAPSDLLVRVPMQVVQSGTDRVFGDAIMLLMRPQQGHLAIAEQLEDFAL